MALKRDVAAKPAGMAIKRVAPSQTPPQDEMAKKEDLLGRLIVVLLKSFDPKFPGKFGLTEKAILDIVDVEDGTPKEYNDFWCYGLLARQIARDLSVGERGLGRIVTGPPRSGVGDDWWGFSFTDEDEDFDRVNAAVAESVVPF